jgi:hypothetical protein
MIDSDTVASHLRRQRTVAAEDTIMGGAHTPIGPADVINLAARRSPDETELIAARLEAARYSAEVWPVDIRSPCQ